MRPMLVLPFLAVATLMSQVAVADSTWTNPNGGAWSDPANWSAGVPMASDVAVFPALDDDGYTVQVGSASCASLAVTGPGIELSNGTLQFASTFDIGTFGSIGSVELHAVQVTGGAYRIGTDGGTGSLSLRDQSAITGFQMEVGDLNGAAGTGAFSVLGRSQALVGYVTLSPNASTTLEYNTAAAGGLVAEQILRGGALAIVAEPGSVLPGPAYDIVRSWQPMTGTFSSVSGPSFAPAFGSYVGPVSVLVKWVHVGPMDPIVALSITPSAAKSPLYVGFRTPFTLLATTLGGQALLSVPYSLSADPAHATVQGLTVLPSVSGPLTLTGSVSSGLGSFTATTEVEVLPTPPVPYDRVDVSAEGTPPASSDGGPAWQLEQPNMSADGRYVAFASFATDLVPADPQPTLTNVFVKDRWTGAIECIDSGGPFASLDGEGSGPTISDDGRYVAFLKAQQGTKSVWLRDRWSGESRRISVGPKGQVNNATCAWPIVSGNGAAVLYLTASSNIVPGVTGTIPLVYRYDVASQTTSVLTSSAGELPNGDLFRPAISRDARYIAVPMKATNILTDNAGTWRIGLLDTLTGTWERIDVGPSGGGTGTGASPSISDDGRFVAFASSGTNLGAPSDGVAQDVFLRDRLAGTTTWLSADVPGLPTNVNFTGCTIAGDGSAVVYASVFSVAMPAFVVRLDGIDQAPKPVGTDPWGTPAISAGFPWISQDGSDILFVCFASDVLPFAPIQTALVVRHEGAPAPEDLTGDGAVNAADLGVLLAAWGSAGGIADLDGDGTVGAGDLALLLAAWTS